MSLQFPVKIQNTFRKMKFFKTIKFHLCRLGIFQIKFDSTSNKRTIITRCGLYITYTLCFLAPAWYRVFEAQTPIEQSESSHFSLSGLFQLSWYTAFHLQREKYTTILDENQMSLFELQLFLTITNSCHTILYCSIYCGAFKSWKN